jgi:hypothetical protein
MAVTAKTDKLQAVLKKIRVCDLKETLSRILPSVWAERYRFIDGRPFTFEGREFMIGPHDVKADAIALMTAAQIGKTNLCMNWLFHDAIYEGKSAFYMFPTEATAYNFSQTKFNTAVRTSPRLSSFFTDVNKVGLKKAGDVEFFIRGSHETGDSPDSAQRDSKLLSVTAPNIAIDEIDRCKKGSVKTVLQRRKGMEEKKVIYVSTPTVPGYGIEKVYRKSDQRVFPVKCPACGERQVMDFPANVEWRESEKDETTRWDSARYRCSKASCHAPWTWEMFRDMVREASRGPEGGWISQESNKELIGFGRLSQLYSPTVRPREIAKEWEEAQGNETDIAIFWRYTMGRAYAADTDRMTLQLLERCRGDYPMAQTSPGAFMGVDVGRPHWVWVAEALQGADGLSKVIWCGDVTSMSRVEEMFAQYHVRGAVFDAAPERELVQQFAERHPGKVFQAFYPPVSALRKHLSWNEGDFTVSIHRTFILDAVMGRIRTRKVSFPADVKSKHLKHFLNVVRMTEKDANGNPVAKWIDDGPDHLFHAAAYCEAAMKKFGGVLDVADLVGDPSFEEGGYGQTIEDDDDWTGGYL